MGKISPSEITPEHLYFSRRKFLAGVGALLTSALFLPGCLGKENQLTQENGDSFQSAQAGVTTDELGAKLTSYKDITHYNNFYEFSTEKEDVAYLAQNFRTSPWTITVEGLVSQPKTFDMDDLQQKFPPEERIYRLRCVEGWSMVIPWLGFPLGALLKEVMPTSKARYVRFEALLDPEQMPGQQFRIDPRQLPDQEFQFYRWPYVEGLRLDEAMHPLTILATGLYGKPLPPQDGAPIRLVVPWKYGFKNIKSIVKIDLVEEMPVSFWMDISPREYGFYANVNPDVPHPRWPQTSERRIGVLSRLKTLPFNGYAEEVAHLYAGMNLREFF